MASPIDLCKSTHKPHPRCNDSLFQGAIPKHEAITEIDLGFSFISGFFCLSFYLDCSKFTSVALLQNPVVKPETVPGLVQRLTRAGTAGLQLWPLCVQKSFHISRSKTTGSKRFSCYWGTGTFSNPVISVSCLLAAGLLPLSISGAIQ